ncbi:hypothetical protein [Variovorax gossypii]
MNNWKMDEPTALAAALILMGNDLLMATMYPGQPVCVMATPKHIARALGNGRRLAGVPFHREATHAEYAAYIREHGFGCL